MTFKSVNPVDGTLLTEIAGFTPGELETALEESAQAATTWSVTRMEVRCDLMHRAATVLRARADELARLMSLEMGKPIKEARAEIEKSAWGCEYYADEGPGFRRAYSGP